MQVEGEDAGGESDWEYEYHETETDSFFVTVDFTTHAPSNSRKRKHNDADDTSGETQRQSEAPTDGTPALNEDTPAPGDDTPVLTPGLKDRTRAPTAKLDGPIALKTVNSSPKRLQFLDLTTSNPLVSYKKEIYTCDWASAIGTDIFLGGPPRPSAPSDLSSDPAPSDPSSTVEPLRARTMAPPPLSSRPGYNILGLSSLRLVAKPAQLNARSTSIPALQPQAPTSALAPAPAPASTVLTPPPAPPLIPTTTPAAQSSFLTRLSAIKAARGDTDTVPLTPSLVDFSRTPLPVPSLDALRSVPVTPRTSTPRARGPGRGRGRGRGRGSRGGRGGVASVDGAGEGEGEGGEGGAEEEVTTPKPRKKREGPGRWGSGRGRGSRARGSSGSSARGRLWTWNGAGGGEGVGSVRGGEGDRSEVVVDPRLESMGMGMGVDGGVVSESGTSTDAVPKAGAGEGEEARQVGEDTIVSQPPSGAATAVADQATGVEEFGSQPSMPQAAPSADDRTDGDGALKTTTE